jgi:cytochrome c556
MAILPRLSSLLLATVAFAQPVGNMSQLMINIIYPTSDAIFYVDRAEPKTDLEWNALANQALMLAESANLLMMPGRDRQKEDWTQFSKAMRDAGQAAFKAANAHSIDGVRDVNDALYNSCVQCHMAYRSNYPKRPTTGAAK